MARLDPSGRVLPTLYESESEPMKIDLPPCGLTSDNVGEYRTFLQTQAPTCGW